MEDIMPTDFQLDKNYPNPVKDKTTIKYSVPDKARIGLEVSDSYRNKVKILVKEIKEAGTYNVEFNAKELASGIYFYRLQAGNFIETKKMVLIK